MDNCLNIDVPLTQTNDNPGKYLNIFHDFNFTCSGYIERWDFYAYTTGNAYIGVWRTQLDGQLKLIGKNMVTANQIGIQVYITQLVLSCHDSEHPLHYPLTIYI